MYYRLVTGLLLLFVLAAYIDTKSIKETINDTKMLKEYKNCSKLIGIGIRDHDDGRVKVKDVVMNTPADRSGLEVGDVVVHVDGKKVTSASALKQYLKDVKKNKQIALTIQKPDNSIVEVSLTPTSINDDR